MLRTMWYFINIYFSGIGEGWRATVLSSQEEYEFIREGQKSFCDSAPYWLGGTTNILKDNEAEYSDYLPNSSGTIVHEINVFLCNILIVYKTIS